MNKFKKMTAEVQEVSDMATKKPKHIILLSPSIVSMSFAHALFVTVLTDLIVYKTCLVSVDVHESECLMLRNNASSPEAKLLEARIAPYASTIVMTKFGLQNMLPAMLCLFLGPWSDTGGRRPVLLVSIAGSTLTHVILSLTSDWKISPWYLLAAFVPANMTGGFWTLKLALNCYVSDISVGKARTLQMALIEASFGAGNVLGSLIGPPIYTNYGSANVFRTAAGCSIFSLIYAHFGFLVTVKNASKESIRGIFHISFVKELVNSVVKKRDGFNRSVVWLAILVLIANAVMDYGETPIEFLFARLTLGWDVQHFSYFSAAAAVIRIAGIGILSLHRHFSVISDIHLAGLSELSALSSAIAKSFTYKSWHMYLSSVIAVFSQIIIPVMRSLIARFVPAVQIGKVFALVSILEILGALAGYAIHTLIYSNYLPPIYPAPVYIFASVLAVLSGVCLVFIHLRTRKCEQEAAQVAAPREDLES